MVRNKPIEEPTPIEEVNPTADVTIEEATTTVVEEPKEEATEETTETTENADAEAPVEQPEEKEEPKAEAVEVADIPKFINNGKKDIKINLGNRNEPEWITVKKGGVVSIKSELALRNKLELVE